MFIVVQNTARRFWSESSGANYGITPFFSLSLSLSSDPKASHHQTLAEPLEVGDLEGQDDPEKAIGETRKSSRMTLAGRYHRNKRQEHP